MFECQVTNAGQALDYKGNGVFRVKNETGCTFGGEKRFQSMRSTLREKKKLPGPAHYDLHQIMDRWRLERTCSTKI